MIRGYLTLLSLLLASTSACGAESASTSSSPSPSASASPSSPPREPTGTAGTGASDPAPVPVPEPQGQTFEITIADGDASTAGERVEVEVGEPVSLLVTSDVAAELHVHSTPEQFLEFAEGVNDPIELVIDRPGVVDIELHDPLEGPVVQLLVQ